MSACILEIDIVGWETSAGPDKSRRGKERHSVTLFLSHAEEEVQPLYLGSGESIDSAVVDAFQVMIEKQGISLNGTAPHAYISDRYLANREYMTIASAFAYKDGSKKPVVVTDEDTSEHLAVMKVLCKSLAHQGIKITLSFA